VSNSLTSHPLNSTPQPDRVGAPGSVETPLIEPATPQRPTQSRIPTAREIVPRASASPGWRLHPAQKPLDSSVHWTVHLPASSSETPVHQVSEPVHQANDNPATGQRDLVVRNIEDTTRPRLELSERSEIASQVPFASAASAGNIASSVVGVVGSIAKAADSVILERLRSGKIDSIRFRPRTRF